MEENKKEAEATKKAYKEARGTPDPSQEEKNIRKRQSISFSISKEDEPITLKDNQIRTFIHRFDLRIEIKPMDSEEECEKMIQK